MRALLVGCGAMATAWVEAVRYSNLVAGRVTIVGLVDSNLIAANTLRTAQELVDVPVFSTLEEAFETVESDVVFDITPPSVRSNIVKLALGANKHVLSEKPMAESLEDAVELAELAKAQNKLFTVIQNRRYKPGVRRIGEFLATGALGEVTGLHADFFIGARFGGFRDHMDHVLLLDMAIHHFDAARFMSGQNAQTVFCRETNPVGSWYDSGPSAFATFQMSKGAFFSYRGSWCAEGARTSWDASWRITGSLGSLVWDGEDDLWAEVGDGELSFLRETKRIDVPQPASEATTQDHASVIGAFLDAVQSGQPAETDSSDNLHSIAMVFGAIESAKTGEEISIEQDFLNR